MKTPTFREQYDKIVTAYLKNELNPLNECACFIGNLLNNRSIWGSGRGWHTGYDTPYISCSGDIAENCVKEESNGLYTYEEIVNLESHFLMKIGRRYEEVARNMKDEDILFKAMESTLLELKKIHESKGEVIEDYTFTKRELVQ